MHFLTSFDCELLVGLELLLKAIASGSILGPIPAYSVK